METRNYTLKEVLEQHNAKRMKNFYSTVLIGTSGSGKTSIAIDLILKIIKNINAGKSDENKTPIKLMIFSDTYDDWEAFDGNALRDFNKKTFVDEVNSILDEQRDNVSNPNHPHLIMVFDDMGENLKTAAIEQVFKRIYTKGRHYKISPITTFQLFTDVPRSLRTNAFFTYICDNFVSTYDIKNIRVNYLMKWTDENIANLIQDGTKGYNFVCFHKENIGVPYKVEAVKL